MFNKLKNLIKGKNGSTSTQLDKICELLDCQPSDVMEYIPDEEDRNAICNMDKRGIENLKEELKQIKKEDGKLD